MCNRGAIIRHRPVSRGAIARYPNVHSMLNKSSQFVVFAGIPLLIVACGKEIPPRSVSEFVENPILLEATMVRCARNRSQTKYDAECVNAREAANRLAAIEDAARRAELESQSEQKRQALRRTQEAAAEARRRAAEAQRRREEAAYLGQFDTAAEPSKTPGTADVDGAAPAPANIPGAVIPPPPESTPQKSESSNTPADLEAIREELKRRQDESR